MFRNMRRKKQQLSQDICFDILKSEKRGVLAVNGENGYPYAIPMNFLFDQSSNAIYLHSAKEGHKIDAIAANDKVCFTTWNRGIQQEGDWSYFVDSVVIFGRAHIVEDTDEMLRTIKPFAMKYNSDEQEVDEDIARSMPRLAMIRIDIEHMSGKHVHER